MALPPPGAMPQFAPIPVSLLPEASRLEQYPRSFLRRNLFRFLSEEQVR